MPNLSMKELAHILETSSSEELLNDDRILEFANELDTAGTNVMQTLDGETMVEMSKFLRSVALSLLLNEGQINLVKMYLLSSDEDISLLCTIVMKLSIGLSITEELR